jgi:hypothetical protein
MRILGIRRTNWLYGLGSGLFYALLQLIFISGSFESRAIGAVIGGLLFGAVMTWIVARGEPRQFMRNGVALPPADRDQVYDLVERNASSTDGRLQRAAVNLARAQLLGRSVQIVGVVIAVVLTVGAAVIAVAGHRSAWALCALMLIVTPLAAVQARKTQRTARAYLEAHAGAEQAS